MWDSGSVHKWSVQSLLQNDKHTLQAIGIAKRARLLWCLSVNVCTCASCPTILNCSWSPLQRTKHWSPCIELSQIITFLLSKQAHEPFCPSPRSPWKPLPPRSPFSPPLIPSCIYKLLSVLTLKTCGRSFHSQSNNVWLNCFLFCGAGVKTQALYSNPYFIYRHIF